MILPDLIADDRCSSTRCRPRCRSTRPWTAASAAGLGQPDARDAGSRDNSANQQFRHLVPLATRPIFGAEPRELSLLFTLFYIAASGNESNPGTFERNFNTRDGAQMWRFVGGTQRIAAEDGAAARQPRRPQLAGAADRPGDGRRARSTADGLDGARQAGDRRHPAHARRPDRLLAASCPPRATSSPSACRQGTLIKVTAVYDKPFWRDDGLNGQAVSLDGPVNATFDDSPPDGSPGVVFGFIGGDEARASCA